METPASEALEPDLAAVGLQARRLVAVCADCPRCADPTRAAGEALLRQLETVRATGRGLPKGEQPLRALLQTRLACAGECPNAAHPQALETELPDLLAALRALRFSLEGPTRAEAWLCNPDRRGALGSLFHGLAARPLISRIASAAARVVLGAAPRRSLRGWASTTFRELAAARPPAAERGHAEVSLFAPCEVQYREPSVGLCALDALEALGVSVVVPEQVCCGLPWLEIGDRAGAAAQARRNVETFAPHVRRGLPVMVLGSSCTAMLRMEAPRLLRTDAADVVARAVQEVTPGLVERLNPGPDLAGQSQGLCGVGYVLGCHSKARDGLRLLGLLPGARAAVVARCSGLHDALGLETEPPELDVARIEPFVAGAEAPVLVSECRHAARALEAVLGRPVLHPVEFAADWLRHRVETAAAAQFQDASGPGRGPEAPGIGFSALEAVLARQSQMDLCARRMPHEA